MVVESTCLFQIQRLYMPTQNLSSSGNTFLRAAAVCCFLTVLTTLGIHLLFTSFGGDFASSVYLFNNNAYILSKFWVILHGILVFIAMTGLFQLLYQQTPGLSIIGLFFYGAFALTEIARQMFVLFYVNKLRAMYVEQVNPVLKEQIRHDIENFAFISDALFGIFILSFSIGNFFYGLSMLKQQNFGKLLGTLLLLWAGFSFLSFSNEFIQSESISSFSKLGNTIFQPVMRLLLAIWLWKQTPLFNSKS